MVWWLRFGVATALLAWTLVIHADYRRSEQQVVRAIRDGNASLSLRTARSYARVIRDEARRRHFDPLTLVSMARWESHWNPTVVNPDDPGYSVGLVQVAAVRAGSDCASKSDIGSEACQRRIARLSQGTYNLRQAAALITLHRRWCRQRTKKPALFARWLSSYQGYNSRPGVTCNLRRDKHGRWRDLPVPKLTRRVIRYRRTLIRRYAQ